MSNVRLLLLSLCFEVKVLPFSMLVGGYLFLIVMPASIIAIIRIIESIFMLNCSRNSLNCIIIIIIAVITTTRRVPNLNLMAALSRQHFLSFENELS